MVGVKLDASMAKIGCQLVGSDTGSGGSTREHKGLLTFSPSVVVKSEREELKSKG